jgi:hypothetical protein
MRNRMGLLLAGAVLVLSGCGADTGPAGDGAVPPSLADQGSVSDATTPAPLEGAGETDPGFQGEDPVRSGESSEVPERSATDAPLPDPALPAPGDEDPLVAAAKADLAAALGFDVSGIVLVGNDKVIWRNGSLGCPQEGYEYTQALVPGNRITLRAGSVDYEYHNGGDRAPFLCEHPTEGLPPGPDDDA